MMKLIILLLFLCLNVTIVHSQNFYKDMITPKNGVQISGGPAFIYANNSGSLRTLGFKLLPSTSIAYSHQVNPYLTIRGTTGIQWLKSNLNSSLEVKERWGQLDKAYGFYGQAIYADLMPTLQMFPSRHQGATFNMYAGAGVGLIHVNSTQLRIINQKEVAKKATVITGYIPIRGAIGKKLNETLELLLEGTIMATFSDELDGNPSKKRIKNDHLLQGQVAMKKYF